MSFGISAIEHVQITVSPDTEAAALAFYRDVLGLREIPKPAALRARGGGWFQVGQVQLHIGVETPAAKGGKSHVCFLVPDLARARAQANAHGIAVDEGGGADGLARFFVRDPAGNRVEIGQR